jgi:hypothetical protein
MKEEPEGKLKAGRPLKRLLDYNIETTMDH